LLNQVVRQHSMLDLINGLCRSGKQGNSNQQSTGNVIALNAHFATLTGFNSG